MEAFFLYFGMSQDRTILVCAKETPDTYSDLSFSNGGVQFSNPRPVLSAYDASALEEALVLSEAHGFRVHVVMVGPERASETLRKALAMGAHEATLLTGAPEEADSAVIAKILASFVQQFGPDAVIMGRQSQDTDVGLAGGMLADHLDWPWTTNAIGIRFEEEAFWVKRQGDSAQEWIASPMPCLITCSNNLNDPRIPTLKGIMASKKKPMHIEGIDSLPGGDVLSMLAPTTTIESLTPMPERAAGELVEGDLETLVDALKKGLASIPETGVSS
jgi:electron transfer flavoprotein beta subunit